MDNGDVDADMVVRNIVTTQEDGARLAGGEYERQPGSYGWGSCHLLPRPPNLPSFGNHRHHHRHHHQLIKITITIAIITIIIKNATISVIKKECKRNPDRIIQVVGVRTQQRLLLLPWQLYHATLILACVGGGFYQVGLVFGVVKL